MNTMKLKLEEPKEHHFFLEAGLDTETPSLKTKPGWLREGAQNVYVDVEQGFRTTKGYEAFNGRPRPSEQGYSILDVTITGSIVADDGITGVDSSATATVVAVDASTRSPQTYLVLGKVTGIFNASENLQVSAVTEGNTDATQVIGAATTPKLHAQYKNLVADLYRSDIAAPTGSGSLLGGDMLADVKYVFRDNVGGTATDLWKNTASGWSQVALGFSLDFTSGGTTEIEEGQVLDGLIGGTPGQATLTRVMLESGSWAAGTAAGKFIFASQTGTFEAGGVEVSGSGDLATIAGDSSAITLSADGRYKIELFNFGGGMRMYGCDGVNSGWEFDGTVFCPISTGMTSDVPTDVVIFKKHLFFSFAASDQHSGIGTPYAWTIISGAAELAIGDTITDHAIQPGGAPETSSQGAAALAIFSRNRINILYGSSSSDWSLETYREEVGAYENSVKELGMTLMVDDRGVVNLLTTQAFGNFSHNSLSRKIQRWMNERKTNVVDSCISRDTSQYRVFFNDKSALYVTTKNRKVVGMAPIMLSDTPTFCFSRENSTGGEEIYFGSTEGMLYQLDKGTSHDGDAIEVRMPLHYNHVKTPRRNKIWKDVSIEVAGESYAEFSLSFVLGYGSTTVVQPAGAGTIITSLSAAWWDSFTWDAFFWDGQTLLPPFAKLAGTSENISLTLASSSDYFGQILFTGMFTHYLLGRQLQHG